jgi:hypothetical protein
MSGDKKFLAPFKGPLDRATRIVLLFWGFIIAIGAVSTYFRPILPWIAGGVLVAFTTWVVIAVVRWRRSKW